MKISQNVAFSEYMNLNFEPIEVQTNSAPQNDQLNLNFLKNIYVDSKKNG